MNAAVVRRTQEALGKVIRRPPLTEKLLNKPPFRYLHDIITEVIRITGFMKGLYTDAEMKSDNVKDKDAKISFLQKAIDVVMMVSGEPLAAKPARIVAGHEPERTNELLQLIGKCCLSKLSSDEAVKRVLAGEKGDSRGRVLRTSKAQEPDNKSVKEEESRTQKEEKRSSEVKERSSSAEHKQKEELKEDSKPREKERDKEKAKEADRDRHREPDRDRNRDGEREKARARAKQDRDRNNKDRDRETERDRDRDRRSDGGKEKERQKDRDRDKGKDRERRKSKNGEHTRDPDREKSRDADKSEKKADISVGASKSSTLKASKRRSKNSLEGRKEDNISAKILDSIVSGLNDEPDQETTAPEIDDNSASLWRENAEPEPAVKQKGDSPSDAEGEAVPTSQDKLEVTENAEVSNELPSSLRRIPRPGSARPAPPRVKRQESTETLAGDRSGSGKTVSTVIIDSQNSDNEDDEQFVVEAAPQLSEIAEIEMVPSGDLEDEEKHGGLVKKILETKKDYEKLQQSPKPGEKERSLIFESAWKKEKDIVSKEIEKLRVSIQTLCKSALPLGKIMDYIQEDVDAMQNELQLWHSENRQHAEALSKEQSITDSAVEPLKAELSELEQQIKDQQDKICAVKANILKNEEKIQKMVHSINLSSRR
ncbi:TRAF3-interacting protein 1 [Rattus norvegicus]|uniref:TRAF3-interacting protein 1 n=1 Tax=Rattus norvegicus TaxID=10116 RepID=MIPT3_RAT|nr:TRAF3-interacting protein 1 [Rattus norvegicus]Q5XIN3.1 RecName: Full=TRAF3-interacting protein 1; AltName: Full=Intraflagellar transport protein 54 homolog; AltName: Full=Microtubule-interacting protein associated with TRAF3; Short=MIP-T3 [Rattus norvegicus]AAH83645.1 TNF receptor-associated factor 3 interacting protein 1 [Rattus norvegicus]|eukprot:NP_001012204.1 TRAF3-interacting protein 1 [Rattus norvegicus]